jgi:pantetheine-phosphate adenylyltransferase
MLRRPQRPPGDGRMNKKRMALYAGSFDPPTRGHLDLVERAAKMFDKVVVAVAKNDAKTSLFTIEERVEMLREMADRFDNVSIADFNGLTVDYAKSIGAVALIRGLRVLSDFEYELSMAINNQKLNPDVDTVCLMPSEPYLFLSSRQVKEIARFNGPVNLFVTPEVEARLKEKMAGLQ